MTVGFTGSPETGTKIMQACCRSVLGGPRGGYRHSGSGRTMSADSILDYTQVKTVVINA
jgi:acyl-CoA reductase-like NAD-dependent aldehyde dehydrogenase